MKRVHLDLHGMIAEGLRRIGMGTGLALVLLLLSFTTVSYGLTLVVRGLTMSFALGLASLAMLVGWLLARSAWPARRSAVSGLVLGFAVLVLHLGGLEADLLALFLRVNTLVQAFFQGPWGKTALMEAAVTAGLSLEQLTEKLVVLFGRLATFFVSLFSGNPTFDPLVILIFWGFALWGTAAWAAWLVRRHARPLVAILPGGTLLAACLSYSGAKPTTLLPLLASALLLMLLVEHQSLQKGWEAAKIDYSEELGLDMAMLAVPLAAMIVAAAAFAPSISPRRISQIVQEALRDSNSQITQIGDSLGLRRAPPGESVYEDMRRPGLPRRHLIGSGPELSQQVVMQVRTLAIELPPEISDPTSSQAARLNYWRWLTYDIYTGSGWMTDRPETVSYLAGEEARPPGILDKNSFPPALPGQVPLTQEIEIQSASTGVLYSVGRVVSADVDYQLAWRPYSAQAGADIFGGTVESPRYRVRSLVSIPFADQLVSSGSDYPEEIRARYLSLPDSLPQRVHALSLELTATLPTPYDRARAIESYLRSIPYNLDVPLPPPGMDVTDYFLFDLKQGYCDYYATAMVVLARAAGIPARLVTGYAGGSYDPDLGIVSVTEADAHSWSELYFPGNGWIEFEPTGGRPDLDNLAESRPLVEVPLQGEPFSTTRPQTEGWWYVVGAFTAGVALTLVGSQLADRRRLARMSPERTVIVLYGRFYNSSAQIAPGSMPSDTPYEFGDKFSVLMDQLTASNRWYRRLAVRSPDINRLTDLYSRAVYSPYLPGRAERELAIQAWDRMRWRLWLLRLTSWSFSGSTRMNEALASLEMK